VSTSAISTLLGLVQSVAAGADAVPSDNALIGSRVRTRRISLGISQPELSRQLEIKSDDLAAYEAGEDRINANVLIRIAKLLDVQPDYFFRVSSREDAKGCLIVSELPGAVEREMIRAPARRPSKRRKPRADTKAARSRPRYLPQRLASWPPTARL
jgi:transcriptional regulator with XRE-family HTH domain